MSQPKILIDLDTLEHNREMTLLWLRSYFKKNSGVCQLDHAIDSVVRKFADPQNGGLPPGPLYGFVTPPKKSSGKLLLDDIPFWHQLNNYRDIHRTCFSSTLAMMVKHYRSDLIQTDDEYLQRVFNIGDTTLAEVQLKALASYSLEPSYSQQLDFEDLDENLESGHPVAIGFLHRGTPQNPYGGHWALCVGRTHDEDAYIFNDPYGSIGDGYTGPIESGHHVVYSKTMLRNRWLVEGERSGWGITARILD